MVWTRLDDQFMDHPKVAQAGPLAGWMHVAGLVYSGRYLTDGFVPTAMIPRLADFHGIGIDDRVGELATFGHDVENQELVDRLVELGMWEPVENGYQIHDYLDYQPSREEVLELRELRAEAGRRGGLKSVESKRQANGQASAEASAEANDQAKFKQSSTPSPSPSPITATTTAPAEEMPPRDPFYALLDRAGVIVGSLLQQEKWEAVRNLTTDFGLIEDAFADAAKQGRVPTPRYIESVLRRCLEQGVRPGEWQGLPAQQPNPPPKRKKLVPGPDWTLATVEKKGDKSGGNGHDP
jgi:hypothetical protein